MKKKSDICVILAPVCLVLVVLFAYLGCTGNSTALLALAMAAGTGFTAAVNSMTGSHDRHDPTTPTAVAVADA